jgi:FAD/FMN-containing dehydrogenase
MNKSFNQSSHAAARDLQNLMVDKVALPGDERYARARRVWNGAVDRHPALIAFCESAQDVQAALHSARAHGLAVSVRGTGYDVAGRSVRSNGLVIDVSSMNQVEVSGRIATVAGGATAANVISAAAASGLIGVTGWHGVVGMAGLTLAGGYGPLIASHGLALDSLVGAEVVLADGQRVTTDADNNPDLLWALRGGGGNFGVVTSMKIRLHPHRSVLGGMILFPWSDANKVLSGYAAVAASAGNDLTVAAGIFSLPDGNTTLFLAPAWTGEPAQGETIVATLQRLGTPIHAQIGTMSYQDLTHSFDTRVVNGRHYALQTRSVPELTSNVISSIIKAGSNMSSPFSTIILQHFRGKATQTPLDATAFGLRRDHFLVEIIAAWEPVVGHDGTDHRSWAQDLSKALAPFSLPGGYPSMLGEDDRDQIAHAYGTNLAKLQDTKRRFDPDGLFSATPLPM